MPYVHNHCFMGAVKEMQYQAIDIALLLVKLSNDKSSFYLFDD